MPIKGAREYKTFKDGKLLTRKQAIVAQCYECNGFEAEDCLGSHCPLYQWSPYRRKPILGQSKLKKLVSPEQIKRLSEGRLRAKQERPISNGNKF